MTLPHQCNDYDGHEIMRFIMVISVSRVEEDYFVVLWCCCVISVRCYGYEGYQGFTRF